MVWLMHDCGGGCVIVLLVVVWLQTELKKRQNDAVKRVANHFKQEAR